MFCIITTAVLQSFTSKDNDDLLRFCTVLQQDPPIEPWVLQVQGDIELQSNPASARLLPVASPTPPSPATVSAHLSIWIIEDLHLGFITQIPHARASLRHCIGRHGSTALQDCKAGEVELQGFTASGKLQEAAWSHNGGVELPCTQLHAAAKSNRNAHAAANKMLQPPFVICCSLLHFHSSSPSSIVLHLCLCS